MPDYTIASYNIRWMNNMFDNNAIPADEANRANAIAAVINRVNPDLLAISEAANSDAEHQHFIDNFLAGGYQVASGTSRGGQNLVFYYRAPFQLVEIDNVGNVYNPWNIDIDEDKVVERFRWDRKPLEAVFSIGAGVNAQRLRFINVHSKSKGIFDVVDLTRFQEISFGNRKKLIAQATKLRERLDALLADQNPLPTVVMGDMNDGPGFDTYERRLGKSFVETTMGSVYNPANIFINALLNIPEDDRWTADFPDPIVSNPMGFNHRVWIDHILVSPDLADANSPIRMVNGSGAIDARDNLSRLASDHFAVYCVFNDD
jgi:endonuclease/exonuclease/phosphatase family metal-dependent hydrolase